MEVGNRFDEAVEILSLNGKAIESGSELPFKSNIFYVNLFHTFFGSVKIQGLEKYRCICKVYLLTSLHCTIIIDNVTGQLPFQSQSLITTPRAVKRSELEDLCFPVQCSPRHVFHLLLHGAKIYHKLIRKSQK